MNAYNQKMKRFFVATLALLIIIGSRAQDCRTVLIMNADPQYSDVKTIVSGAAKELDTNALQQQLNAGYRVIDAAYTSNGWIVALSKKSGIKSQIFKYEADLDDKWIDQETKKGKICSTIVISNDKCLMIMSEDPSVVDQQVEAGYFDDMCDSYDKLVDKGYILTFAYPVDEGWVWSLAKSSKCKDQNAVVIKYSDFPNFLEYMNEASQRLLLHRVLCCDEYAVVFFGSQTLNGNTAEQKVAIDPANVTSAIATNKQSGFYLSSISGTIGTPYASDDNGNPTEGRLMTAAGNTTALQIGVVGGLFKERDAEFYKVKDCSVCGGTGKCNYCDGSGYEGGNYYNGECSHCEGKRRCFMCGGEGRVQAGLVEELMTNAMDMLPGLYMAKKQIDEEKANRAKKGLGMPTRWEVRIVPNKKAMKQIQGDNPMQFFEGLQNIFK